jgi:hypothetical protein
MVTPHYEVRAVARDTGKIVAGIVVSSLGVAAAEAMAAADPRFQECTFPAKEVERIPDEHIVACARAFPGEDFNVEGVFAVDHVEPIE